MIQELFCGIQPPALIRLDRGNFAGGMRTDTPSTHRAGTLENASRFFNVLQNGLPHPVLVPIAPTFKNPKPPSI